MSAKKKKPLLINSQTEIEVVMRKEMTIQKYQELKASPKTKGWKVQGYQKDFFNIGIKNEV